MTPEEADTLRDMVDRMSLEQLRLLWRWITRAYMYRAADRFGANVQG